MCGKTDIRSSLCVYTCMNITATYTHGILNVYLLQIHLEISGYGSSEYVWNVPLLLPGDKYKVAIFKFLENTVKPQ